MQQPQGYEQGGPGVGLPLQAPRVRVAPGAACVAPASEGGARATWDSRHPSFECGALLRRSVGGQRVYLVVWVDDILIATLAKRSKRSEGEGASWRRSSTCGTMGEATYFLGMELTRDREARTLKLRQKKLTGELIGRYGLASARARSVPLETRDKLTKEGGALDTTVFPYAE